MVVVCELFLIQLVLPVSGILLNEHLKVVSCDNNKIRTSEEYIDGTKPIHVVDEIGSRY